jgi:subtilisin family serine protease
VRLRTRALLAALLGLILSGCASGPSQSQAQRGQPSSAPTANPERLVVVTVRNTPGPRVPRAGSTVRDYDTRSYSISPLARSTARAIAASHNLREVSSWPIAALGLHCLVYELPIGTARGVILETLRLDHRVESAQPLHTFDTLSTANLPATSSKYNDPYQRLQENLQTLGIHQAHEWSRGEGIAIAVIDTAVDVAHPDLRGRVTRQQSFLEPAALAASNPQQRAQHGTAVAGVIAAVANNWQGIVGIAPAATVHAWNACWPDAGNTGRSFCNTFTLAKALAAAVDNSAHIINLSLAGPSDPLLTRLVKHALRRGVIVVGATAGEHQSPYFPADIDGVISVSSTATGTLPAADGHSATLLAPGTDVLTLVPSGDYDFQSGSSLATASISGGIALLLARDHQLGAAEVRQLLAASSQLQMTAVGATYSVNICTALARLIHRPDCGAR